MKSQSQTSKKNSRGAYTFRIGFPLYGTRNGWEYVVVHRFGGKDCSRGWLDNKASFEPFTVLENKGASIAIKCRPSEISARSLCFSHIAAKRDRNPSDYHDRSDTAACMLAFCQKNVPNADAPTVLVSCDCEPYYGVYNGTLLNEVSHYRNEQKHRDALLEKWESALNNPKHVCALVLHSNDLVKLKDTLELKGNGIADVVKISTTVFDDIIEKKARWPFLIEASSYDLPLLAESLHIAKRYFEPLSFSEEQKSSDAVAEHSGVGFPARKSDKDGYPQNKRNSLRAMVIGITSTVVMAIIMASLFLSYGRNQNEICDQAKNRAKDVEQRSFVTSLQNDQVSTMITTVKNNPCVASAWLQLYNALLSSLNTQPARFKDKKSELQWYRYKKEQITNTVLRVAGALGSSQAMAILSKEQIKENVNIAAERKELEEIIKKAPRSCGLRVSLLKVAQRAAHEWDPMSKNAAATIRDAEQIYNNAMQSACLQNNNEQYELRYVMLILYAQTYNYSGMLRIFSDTYESHEYIDINNNIRNTTWKIVDNQIANILQSEKELQQRNDPSVSYFRMCENAKELVRANKAILAVFGQNEGESKLAALDNFIKHRCKK